MEDRRREANTTSVVDREEIVKQHLWLVRCIAQSIAEALPRSVDVADLISAGTVGLIRAIDEYDPSKGAKLETYARYKIRGAIFDELRKQDILPYSVRSKVKQIDRAISELERELGRYPEDDEIAERVGLEVGEISKLLAMAGTLDLYSLEELLENGEISFDMVEGENQNGLTDPLTRLEREELVKVLVNAIKELPETERTILGLYYYEGLRMKEIGEVLGISESRVSQIHSKAILFLRSRLRVRLSK